MVFSSAVFLFLFLPFTLLIYYLPLLKPLCHCMTSPLHKERQAALEAGEVAQCVGGVYGNIWLLFASLCFYAWGEPLYVFLMILSILANYFFGLLLSNCPKSRKGKFIVAFSCLFNLGILFFFKYFNWVCQLVNFNQGGGGNYLNIILPIGISFYTFQALSYVIDIYRGKHKAQKNIIDAGLYISFFPQLIAGPIVRYGSIEKQLRNREHSFSKFSEGVWRFSIGLVKKVFIADQVANIADLAWLNVGENLSVVLAWAGAFAFMLQLYFDFSGYSDMAIGLGKMFGFEFNENFNYPYISKSISEYWRRWHISLGEWFRDYLYYPLSLGFAVKFRKNLAKIFGAKISGIISSCSVLLIVWLSTGLWHGANMTYVLWGLINFFFIAIEQYRTKNNRFAFLKTFVIVFLCKVLTKSDSISQALQFYSSMFHLNGNVFIDNVTFYWLNQYKIIMIIGTIFIFPVVERINKFFSGKKFEKVWLILRFLAMLIIFLITVSYVIAGNYNPFLYFNF